MRPHKSGKPDALQYTPVFNGLSAWQLYYGDGCTNAWRFSTTRYLGNFQTRVFLFLGLSPVVSILMLERQHRLTFSRPDSSFWAGALVAFSGGDGRIHDVGLFLDLWLLPWKESIILDILSAPSSTGCFFIISRGFLENTSIVLKRSTDISGPSSRMLSRSISTAAIRCAGLPASGVRVVEKSVFSCFPVRLVVSARRAMQNAVRNGASG